MQIRILIISLIRIEFFYSSVAIAEPQEFSAPDNFGNPRILGADFIILSVRQKRLDINPAGNPVLIAYQNFVEFALHRIHLTDRHRRDVVVRRHTLQMLSRSPQIRPISRNFP